jgi:hypothetical protein
VGGQEGEARPAKETSPSGGDNHQQHRRLSLGLGKRSS